MLLGVDVWEGYGPIDWAQAKAAGVRFAFVKCTTGNNDNPATVVNEGKDPRFDEYVAGAKAAGVPVGPYLYGYALPTDDKHPGRSPEDQARRLYADSKGLGRAAGELPPVLDLEFPARWDKRYVDEKGNLIDQWVRWGVTAESIARWALACLAEMERLWGRVPILYTYPDFWARLGPWGKLPEWKRFMLWIAAYVPEGMKQPLPGEHEKPIIPGPWDDWSVWQFSADGSPVHVPGISRAPIDRNVVKDEAMLRRLTMIDEPPPAFIDLTTVRGIQSRLAALGFDPGPVDGVAGPQTRAATVAFQKAHKLVADGVVGTKTRAALAAG